MSSNALPLDDLRQGASVKEYLALCHGRPDPADAILAAHFAEAAMDAIATGDASSGVVAMREGRIRIVPFGSTTDNRDASQWRKTATLHHDLSGW